MKMAEKKPNKSLVTRPPWWHPGIALVRHWLGTGKAAVGTRSSGAISIIIIMSRSSGHIPSISGLVLDVWILETCYRLVLD